MAGKTTALVGKLQISGKEARAELDATKKKFDELTREFTKPVGLKIRAGMEGAGREIQKYSEAAKANARILGQNISTNGVYARAMGQVGSSSMRAGMGVLELSRAFEDAQYGIRGVLNNIPGIIQSFGGSAGIAGAVSAAAVGLSLLATNLDFTGEAHRKAAREAHELTMKWKEQTEAAEDAARQAIGVRHAQEAFASESELAAESHRDITDAIEKEAGARHANADAALRQVAAFKSLRESRVRVYGFGISEKDRVPGQEISGQRNIDRDAERDTFHLQQKQAEIDEAANKARAADALKEAAEAKTRARSLRFASADLLDPAEEARLRTLQEVDKEKLAKAKETYEALRNSKMDPMFAGLAGAQMSEIQNRMIQSGARLQAHEQAQRSGAGVGTPGEAREQIRALEKEARDKEREARLLNERVAASAKERGVSKGLFGDDQARKDEEAAALARHENALRIIQVVVDVGQRTLSDLKEAAGRILDKSKQVLQNIHADQDLSISEIRNPRRRRKVERVRDLSRRIQDIKKERPGISDLEAASIADREQRVRDRAAGDRTIHGAGPARQAGGLDEFKRFQDKTIPLGTRPKPEEARGRAAVERAIEDVKRSGGKGGPGETVTTQLISTLKTLTEVLRDQTKGPNERNKPLREN